MGVELFYCTNGHLHVTWITAANCYRAGAVTPAPVERVRVEEEKTDGVDREEA